MKTRRLRYVVGVALCSLNPTELETSQHVPSDHVLNRPLKSPKSAYSYEPYYGLGFLGFFPRVMCQLDLGPTLATGLRV